MNYLEISKHIKDTYLLQLENFKIENLKSLTELHERLIQIRVELHFKGIIEVMPHYRGEQSYGWDILPGIYRPPFSLGINLNNARIIEEKGINLFKKYVSEELGENQLFKHGAIEPYGEKWDLLFQAQHAGVKTNLIDFSTSILLSSYFACEPSPKHEKDDGQMWCLLVPSEFIFNETSDYSKLCYPNYNPFELNESFMCNVPVYLDDIEERTYQFRLFRQHGRLFASPNSKLGTAINKMEFWENMIFRVRIPSDVKKIIIKELSEINVTRETMMIIETNEANNIIEQINNEIIV